MAKLIDLQKNMPAKKQSNHWFGILRNQKIPSG
jgi:hypothetical protein